MSDSETSNWAEQIQNGEAVVGIELGSTRMKAVLVDLDHRPLASGSYEWENTLVEGVWTYSMDEVWSGLQACFDDLQQEVHEQYGVHIQRLKAMGFSGMMHGYLALDAVGKPLVPFRTWRNNITGPAAEALTKHFNVPIPQRWSIAHLYQAILNREDHVGRIDSLTTLAGYVHWNLTGRRAVGLNEASGMFPLEPEMQDYHAGMMKSFHTLISDQGYDWSLDEILPEALPAGEAAGVLTEEGARRLDSSGHLQAGIPLCPPEGDAGTGMVATNSVDVRTGNVSAGTSVFAMLVLEKELSKLHEDIDLITTPDGKLVGMAHSGNCTTDIDAWVRLLGEAASVLGAEFSTDDLYGRLLPLALQGDSDCGGLLSYGYISGEHITGFNEGRPLFVRSSDSQFTLANFIRCHLFTSLCALRTGLNILVEDEGVRVDEIRGHGGFFKTPEIGQRMMAAATGIPVSVLSTAGEGGAWGIALLASFAARDARELTLPEFLQEVFRDSQGEAVPPDSEDQDGFAQFFQRYHQGLGIERAAVDSIS